MDRGAIIRTERGWPGHFILALRCRFRRNTLLRYGDVNIVVSTVGLMEDAPGEGEFREVGFDRYFETMAFRAKHDGRYWEADVGREVSLRGQCAISVIDADDQANDMHEAAVAEIMERMVALEFSSVRGESE